MFQLPCQLGFATKFGEHLARPAMRTPHDLHGRKTVDCRISNEPDLPLAARTEAVNRKHATSPRLRVYGRILVGTVYELWLRLP